MQFTPEAIRMRICSALPNGPERVTDVSSNGSNSRDPIVDLAGLLLLQDDDEFLRESYRRVLGRECDLTGFLSYSELLDRHVPRRLILHHLINSPEAKQKGRRYLNAPGPPSGSLDRLAGMAAGRVAWLVKGARKIVARIARSLAAACE